MKIFILVCLLSLPCMAQIDTTDTHLPAQRSLNTWHVPVDFTRSGEWLGSATIGEEDSVQISLTDITPTSLVMSTYTGIQSSEGAYPIFTAVWSEGVLTIYGTAGLKVAYYARRK
jgi:hypothetical protein